MTRFEQLECLLTEYGGILKVSQVMKRGIAKPIFYNFVKQKGLEQVAHGVYASSDVWLDYMYLIHLRCSQAVYSYETALFFHDLTDREPSPYSITVKRGYSISRLKADGIEVHTVKPELHDVGIVYMKTSFGYTVPVYNMERTICDVIRSRNKIEIQTFQDAIRGYVRKKDKDLHELMKYAELFHVEKIVRQYLEVLL